MRLINFDKTEIVVMDTSGKSPKVFNLTYQDIMRIQFRPVTERVLLVRSVPSEVIEIFTSKKPDPIRFFKRKNKKYFDEYKKGLAKFAANNNVSFDDHTAGAQAE